MGRLQHKVVFLTGAGGVLGGASAAVFAREGARIAAADALEETVRATVETIEDSTGWNQQDRVQAS